MNALATVITMAAAMVAQGQKQALPDRFEFAAPLPTLPPVVVDKMTTGIGVAHQTARSKNLQGRMLWVDCTANIDRYNSTEKIIALVEKAKSIGFNTIVLDVKPIVGYTIYPSAYTDKLLRWRDAFLDKNFDPVPIFVDSCKKNGISFFVSMNAFSEGHRIAREMESDPNSPFGKAGPGYDRPEEQTVQYVPVPYLRLGQESAPLNPKMNPKELGDDEVGMYSGAPTQTGRMIIIDSRGVVQLNDGKGIPDGGRVLVGRGKAATFLERMALPGRRLEIMTVPTFERASEVQNQIPLMMNPTNANVRQRVINFAKEVVQKYPVDGLLFDDRLRFGGVDADFSESTRKQFEKHVGAQLNWPKDVFEFTYNWNLERGVRPGPYWDRWWTWRALQLQSWVIAVRQEIKRIRPTTQFGIYAGSWYAEYTKWGANYGRPGTRTPFSGVSKGFSDAGFADQLEVFVAGCYYKVPTIAEALSLNASEGRTVEAGAALANRVIHDQAWTYAGIMLQDFYGDPEALEDALQAACASSQGVMVFDLSHRFEQFEPILRRAFKFKVQAPHQVPGLLTQVRSMLVKREKLGGVEPPIFIQPGAPGVGH